MKKWIRFLSCVCTSPLSKAKKKSHFPLLPFQKTHRKAPSQSGSSLFTGLVHARTALSGSADPHDLLCQMTWPCVIKMADSEERED